jgi:hypothetical protein
MLLANARGKIEGKSKKAKKVLIPADFEAHSAVVGVLTNDKIH